MHFDTINNWFDQLKPGNAAVNATSKDTHIFTIQSNICYKLKSNIADFVKKAKKSIDPT